MQENGQIRITVRDNGIGIPDNFDISRSNSLGLKLIRTLVQHQLKGSLMLTSRNGTEISIEFPVIIAGDITMSKILVVDDEAIITMQLEERLSAMGYTVAGMAASGEDAVDKARRLRPDLVLMDIVMPGKMNGIEAAKIITGELDIPVVFVTSYADDTIIEKAKSVRPYGYIVKPFNELEIKAAIEVALFRKATEQEEQKLKKSAQEKISQETEAGHPGTGWSCLSRSAGNKNRSFKRYLHRYRSLPLHRPGRKRTNI